METKVTFTNGHALLIGVGKYQHNTYTPYAETATDARELAAVLRDPERCGYPDAQVTPLLDEQATHSAILSAFDTLRQNTNADSTVLVFYSGHGDFGPNNTYFLTTYDTQKVNGAIDPNTALSEQELLEKLRALPAKRAFLIFNACFSGEIAPSLGGGEGEILPERTAVALLGTGEGRVIITACRQNQKSYLDEPAKPLTFFGQALVDALRGEGVTPRRGYIGVSDMYEAVYTQVKQKVEERWARLQEPELTINKAVGPLPVALYQGSRPTGALGPADQPRSLSGGVRQVEQAEAERVMNQILSGNFAVKAERIERSIFIGGDVHGDFVGGDKVGGDKVGGDKVGDINNRDGQVAVGRDITQNRGAAPQAVPFRPNTSRLIDIMKSKLQPTDMDTLALVMGDHGFIFDPAALPAGLPEQVNALIRLCQTNKAITALVQGLIDREAIDSEQAAWQEWAQKQDKRT
jgi:hypothetical protein